jgi:beta-galactosidase
MTLRLRSVFTLAGCLAFVPRPLPIGAQTPQATPPPLYRGTAWYPEQRLESRWDADLSLMEAAGVRFASIGEFAWSRMEPSEGRYDLDWLEHAVRAAEKHHIAVVLATRSGF